MTDQQQPKEYIITEEELRKAVTLTDWDKISDLCSAIRSRPHPAPETPNQKMSKELRMATSLYREGRKDGERKAREDVLKTFTKLWRDNYCPELKKACHADDGKDYCPICILKESLRHHSEQQEQPR